MSSNLIDNIILLFISYGGSKSFSRLTLVAPLIVDNNKTASSVMMFALLLFSYFADVCFLLFSGFRVQVTIKTIFYVFPIDSVD